LASTTHEVKKNQDSKIEDSSIECNHLEGGE